MCLRVDKTVRYIRLAPELNLENIRLMAERGVLDTVYIHDLRVDATIGVNEWERRIRQQLVIDLDLAIDTTKAAASDHIRDTICYGTVARRIMAFVEESRFQLLETLAEGIARILREEFKVSWVRLKINKQGAVRGVRDVGVIIERGERGTA